MLCATRQTQRQMLYLILALISILKKITYPIPLGVGHMPLIRDARGTLNLQSALDRLPGKSGLHSGALSKKSKI